MSKRYQAGILTASYNGLKVPNAPTIGTATAGAGSASVTFTAPSDVGGGAITSYTVISSPGSITGTGSSSPITVSGLTNGTAYTFTVVATNAYGTGPASAASNSVTPSVNYIEDVFSTYLYTGTGASQTITNGIDLSTKGGLVWTKTRSGGAGYDWHVLVDSARGVTKVIETNLTDAEATQTDLTSFTTTGYNLAAGSYYGTFNLNNAKFVSWTFRKQAKFFDIVTYTGNGTGARQISHNLGSEPGCIIVKRTDGVTQWPVYHRSVGAGNYKNGLLNMVDAFDTLTKISAPTSTYFTVSADGDVNASGGTYVAYLFAHNAGGFGLNGTDNVISCGSVTLNSSGAGTVNLGYEPQWVLMKTSTSANDWIIFDTMRGFSVTGGSGYNTLNPNLSAAEFSGSSTYFQLTNTGFSINMNFVGWQSQTLVYIAIRRGPMKVPTSGTSVFSPVLRNGTGANANIQSGFPTDLIVFLNTNREWDAMGNYWTDRMRSGLKYLTSTATNAEGNWNNVFQNNNGFDTQNGVLVTSDVANGVINHSGTPYINWFFRRAPSFFDEVCYTGTDAVRTINHNLGVAPELIIVKGRNTNPANSSYWTVYTQPTGNTNYMYLDSTNATSAFSGYWNNTSPTASVFTLGTGNGEDTNATGKNYVAYLFATCAGVSKVGSYTGNGSTQTINCGFTGGARFVLIKRTDDAGDWYVYDTARGMTTLTDPYLRLNTTTAEFATLGSVTTVSTGFAVNASILAAINTNAASYIFLAIA